MSKGALKKASFTASKALDSADLSFQSMHDYKRMLQIGLRQLSELGFKLHSINQLKQKHINSLINHWKSSGLNVGTIKNRLSAFRRVAEITGRKQIVKSNKDYELDSRSYIPEVSKGIHEIDLNTIDNSYVRASLELQKEFGLRREEAIKFKPHQADKGLAIELQASWTKGGIQRLVPITNQSQRECLDRIKGLVTKDKSLIPDGIKYKNQRDIYDYITRKQGLTNLHGLRHAYAQRRYKELTNQLTNGHGWVSPIQGGPDKTSLNSFEKHIDKRARLMISQELGHSRIAITKSYLG